MRYIIDSLHGKQGVFSDLHDLLIELAERFIEHGSVHHADGFREGRDCHVCGKEAE